MVTFFDDLSYVSFGIEPAEEETYNPYKQSLMVFAVWNHHNFHRNLSRTDAPIFLGFISKKNARNSLPGAFDFG